VRQSWEQPPFGKGTRRRNCDGIAGFLIIDIGKGIGETIKPLLQKREDDGPDG
jgi:hypothetical protein